MNRRPVRYSDLPVWTPGLVIPAEQRGCSFEEWERGRLAEAKAAFLARERAAVVPPVAIQAKKKEAKRNDGKQYSADGF